MPEGVGLSATPVYFILKDAAVVQNAVKEAGFDEALIDQEGLVEGKRGGKFTVYLVLRGDSDLNGEVSVEDAQNALNYYTKTLLAHKTAKDILQAEDPVYLRNKGDQKEMYFPYSHYAMDVADGNGDITVDDAQDILRYYVAYTVTHLEGSWDDEKAVGHAVTVKEELHAEPLAIDTAAADYKGLNRNVG